MRYAFIYVLLCLTNLSFGQHLNFENYSVSDGLSQSQVYAIEEDSRGNIWFGTQGGGISIYNGQSFRTITTDEGLLSNYIYSIYEDSKGVIWIATNKGLNKYDGLSISSYSSENGLNATAVHNIAEGKNNRIVLGTSNGVIYLENDEFTQIRQEDGLAGKAIFNVAVDGETTWAATDRGLCRVSENIVCFSKLNRTNNKMMRAVAIADSTLWCGTYGGGLSAFNDGKGISFEKDQGLDAHLILCLFIDSKKNLWVGTEGQGAFKYDGKKFRSFKVKDGLANNSVRAIFEDSFGNVWFGTSGGGVSMLKDETFIHYDSRDGLPGNGVYAIGKDSVGTYWFGTFAGGVTMYQDDFSTHITGAFGFTSKKVKAIFRDSKGRMWFGSEGDGAFLLTDDGFRNYKNGGSNSIGGNWVKHIEEDDSGNLWFATAGGGISKFDGSKWTRYKQRDGLVSDRVNDFAFTEKEIWLATDHGVSVMNGTSIGNFVRNDGLPARRIKCVEIDKYGNAWFGSTGGGIFSIVDEELKSFSKKDGLSSGNIYLLHADKDGFLWVGSEKGIDRVTTNQDGTIKSVEHYGKSQGFTGMETCQNATYEEPGGKIWFGTIAGVTRYDAKLDQKSTYQPKTHLINVMLPYEPISKFKTGLKMKPWYPVPESLELAHNENHITFEFHGNYLRNPESIRYQWQLEGFEKNWSPWSDQQRVTYSNLNAGTYVFRVKSIASGSEESQPVTFEFTVNKPPPPFYKKTWFVTTVLAIVLVVLGLIAYIIYYRIRRRNERLRMQRDVVQLEQKALYLQMNPHFLFNCLNSIKGYIAENRTQEAKILLSKFAKLMRSILDNSRHQFVSLETEIETLKNYMDLEQISHENVFEYEFEVDDEMDPSSISIPSMLVQPFIENAILHGLVPKQEIGKLTIKVNSENEILKISVQDNGIGREKAKELKKQTVQKRESAGIDITESRIKILANELNREGLGIEFVDLQNEKGEPSGTRVDIALPIM